MIRGGYTIWLFAFLNVEWWFLVLGGTLLFNGHAMVWGWLKCARLMTSASVFLWILILEVRIGVWTICRVFQYVLFSFLIKLF
jgi:hypothetical protein